MNTLGIDQPCLPISKNEVLFEIYIIALKQYKDAIYIEGENEIKRNRLFFDYQWIHVTKNNLKSILLGPLSQTSMYP